MAIDPVCGMTIDEKTAAAQTNYRGTTYYFCSAACKAKFDADPGKYTAGQAATPR
jgi:Cu+-exporting ATPase